MIITEHSQRFKKWHSYKANVILSCLEVVFWGAVAFLVMQANLKMCTGVSCVLSWIVVGIAVVIKYVCCRLSLYNLFPTISTPSSTSTLFFSSRPIIYASIVANTGYSHTELYTAAVCIREFRESKRTKNAVQIESPRGSWKHSDVEVSLQSYPTIPRPARV
jgi:hypothetical protein